MKTFSELFIHLKDTSKEKFDSELLKIISPIWQRQIDKEKSSKKWAIGYLHKGKGDLPEAGLWIMTKAENDRLLYVTNIIPHKTSSLTTDEYNSILKNFYETILKPNENRLKITVEITPDLVIAENEMNSETYIKLKTFCYAANKTTKATHPLDRKRWYDFIITSYSKNDIVTTSRLQGFLIDLGWAEDDAIDLVIEYEFAIGLLKEFSGHND